MVLLVSLNGILCASTMMAVKLEEELALSQKSAKKLQVVDFFLARIYLYLCVYY